MTDYNPINRISLDELNPELRDLVLSGSDDLNKLINSHINNSTIHMTQEEKDEIGRKANKKSPIFTGIPQAPTANVGTTTDQIATTKFVNQSIDNFLKTAKITAEALTNPIKLSIIGGATSSVVSTDFSNDVSINVISVNATALKGTINKTNLTGKYDISISGTADHATNSDKLGNIAANQYAQLQSPAFSGTPTCPTPAVGTKDKTVVNAEFVSTAMTYVQTGSVESANKFTKPIKVSINGDATAAAMELDGTKDVALTIKNINATTIESHTVKCNVPANAKFTDTVYTHPVPPVLGEKNVVYTGFSVDELGHIVYMENPTEFEADITGNAATANKWFLARTFTFTGAVTGSMRVNGTQDLTVPMTLSDFDASKITTGTIDPERLPKGAVVELVIVANDTERFALTTARVQKNDTVKVRSTGKTYFVVDETKLNSEAGYEPYTADAASTVPWTGVTGKPASYTPSSHTQTATTIIEDASHRFFTDTERTKLNGIAEGANKYVHPTTSGNKHIPAGGKTGQVLGFLSDGTAQWVDKNSVAKIENGSWTIDTSGNNLVITNGVKTFTFKEDGTFEAPKLAEI